jgi:DNA-binding Lrp family transcriptional regulator
MRESRYTHDKTDDKIINILVKHPKMSQAKIAAIIGMSQPALWLRLKNLEKHGVIRYSVEDLRR